MPLPSAPTVPFPSRLSLAVGTFDGLVYPELVDGKPARTGLRACQGPVATLRSFGRKVLVVCRQPSHPLSIVDADAGTLSVIPGVEALEATWSVNGEAIVYTTIGACEPPAPIWSILRGYRVSDGAFASVSGANITAFGPLGPAKPARP